MLSNKLPILLCVGVAILTISRIQARPDFGGIYTQEQIDQYRKANMEPYGDAYVGLGKSQPKEPLSLEQDPERSSVRVYRTDLWPDECACNKAWDSFITVGTICAWITSIYMCLQIIKFVANAVTRFRSLGDKERGRQTESNLLATRTEQ